MKLTYPDRNAANRAFMFSGLSLGAVVGAPLAFLLCAVTGFPLSPIVITKICWVASSLAAGCLGGAVFWAFRAMSYSE